MAGPSPYSDTARVADGLIVDQLKMVHTEVKEGFGRQERHNEKMDARFETMVTKAEFAAEIGRVDAQHGHLSEKLYAATKANTDATAAGFKQIKEESEARATKGRWFTGIVIAAAGMLSGLIFNILANIPK